MELFHCHSLLRKKIIETENMVFMWLSPYVLLNFVLCINTYISQANKKYLSIYLCTVMVLSNRYTQHFWRTPSNRQSSYKYIYPFQCYRYIYCSTQYFTLYVFINKVYRVKRRIRGDTTAARWWRIERVLQTILTIDITRFFLSNLLVRIVTVTIPYFEGLTKHSRKNLPFVWATHTTNVLKLNNKNNCYL